MALFYWIAFPVLALAVVTAIFPERVTALFAGSGKRRFTKASAARLTEEIGVLSMQLSAAKRKAERPCPNCHHAPDDITAAELAESDRTDPAGTVSVPAPVDAGCRDTPSAAAATARDNSLAAMARPGEEEMLAALEAERAKSRAAAEADTQVIATVPAVVPVRPLFAKSQDPETAAIEATLSRPGPDPLHSATAVPAGIPDKAQLNVAAALSEAS